MRKLETILKEVHIQAANDNCQSWNSVALIAMEKAIKESREEIIEQLEKLSDEYEYVDHQAVIFKTDLDDYISNLDI